MTKLKAARLGSAFVIALSFAAIAGMPAHAAVRTCTARLTSIAATDATELGAKKKAISDWMLKATAAGIKSPAWRLAAERRLICQQHIVAATPSDTAEPAKVYECIAAGHACTITQNPAKSLPQPTAKARDLET